MLGSLGLKTWSRFDTSIIAMDGVGPHMALLGLAGLAQKNPLILFIF
jgi:hypothetical protein